MIEMEYPPDNLRLILDSDFGLSLLVSPTLLLIFVGILLVILIIRIGISYVGPWSTFEIDEAEFGLGDQRIRLRPNDTDRQIAYKIWVELSTRKIGLEIDLDNDVITEIYDSWYNFFSVTRELIKEVPVNKFRRKDTERIIRLSIDVLNYGIRPHLTKWQARFRRWYERQISNEDNIELHPQDIQSKFPQYEELKEDILSVNKRLIEYRQTMYKLISRL